MTTSTKDDRTQFNTQMSSVYLLIPRQHQRETLVGIESVAVNRAVIKHATSVS